MDSIRAVEILRTFQGEISIGQRVLLIRFKKCNRNCYFCDTRLKLANLVEGEYTLKSIQKIITYENRGLLITGGEPLFDVNFDQTVSLLTELGYPFADVETNGCNLLRLYEATKDRDNIRYVYSPKDFYNGNADKLSSDEYIEKCIETIGDKLIFKIINFDHKKTLQILDFLKDFNISQNVYLMPMGKTRDEVLEAMPMTIALSKQYGFNVTTRMHLIHNFE